jgi:deferrochelatase/peroxidase EfeB
MNRLPEHDIQGIVLSGYPRQAQTRYVILRFEDGQRTRLWLKQAQVTDASERTPRLGDEGAHRTNLALSFSGLRRLGLDEAALATFPRELAQGMAHPERAQVLSDEPKSWRFGGNGAERVDGLLMLYAGSEAALADLVAHHESLLTEHGIANTSIPAYLGATEPFGFVDGLSQPAIEGSGKGDEYASVFDRPLPVGEFLLGHLNAYGRIASGPRFDGQRDKPPDELGVNGSYLVLRQLAQHIGSFWRYFYEAAGKDPQTTERLASLAIGRRLDGTPLMPAEGDNGFGYRTDPHGRTCPLGAHVRRANPRDLLGDSPDDALLTASRHRLLRRGRNYGGPLPQSWTAWLEQADPGPDEERGLVFIALCADLRRQFEFIQQTWLNSRKFGGLYEERDPLVGQGIGESCFSIGERPVCRRLRGLARFVDTRGGEYLFLPSMTALRRLAQG